jgi:hypothetical protein
MSEESIVIPLLVTAVDSNGNASFYPVKVVCTQADYDVGEHYTFAKEAAENDGYEPSLAFDAIEAPEILRMVDWSPAAYVGCIGKPVKDRPARGPSGLLGIGIAVMELEERQRVDAWSECPMFAREDWRASVTDNSTQLGYWDWARNQHMI